VLAYHARLDREVLWEAFRLRRLTLAYLVECWGVVADGGRGVLRLRRTRLRGGPERVVYLAAAGRPR